MICPVVVPRLETTNEKRRYQSAQRLFLEKRIQEGEGEMERDRETERKFVYDGKEDKVTTHSQMIFRVLIMFDMYVSKVKQEI